MENDIYIEGGAFQIARKIFESDLWINKPATWKIIWVYILGNVNHKKTEGFERGEGFFNFSRNLRKIGNDITEDMVKKFCQYSRKFEMISTKRSTRGIRIKVINYNKYQTMGSYICTSLSTREAREKHERSTPINKNVKNEKEGKEYNNAASDIEELLNEKRGIQYDYQYLGLEVYEKTGAPSNKKAECIRIAKKYPNYITPSLSFCLDYPNPALKWKMFLWKLNSLIKPKSNDEKH